jgi:lipopolysaccharide/colanic/teichoic acid biosynthesis glycosyltransferase
LIQTKPSGAVAPSASADRPTVWGLTALELHDAFWNAHGIQCVRRGQTEPLQQGADLFLLIEPDQLVLFDVLALADRLAWRKAAVTRLRVLDQSEETYGEHVEVDQRELVMRIARRYRARSHASYRVALTRRRRIARAWMAAHERRNGWRKIQRMAGTSHIDTRRYPGACFNLGDAAEEAALIQHLVETWRRPDRAIHGIHEIRENVWMVRGAPLSDEAIVIGPAWLGRTQPSSAPDCLIGPSWIGDGEPMPDCENGSVRRRLIAEIDPSAEGHCQSAATRSGAGYALAKRCFDVLLSGLGLAMASPALLIIAACILVEDGRPIFFGQQRQARGGRIFRCWKFRTMCRDADRIKHQLAKDNLCDGPQFYVKNDPRATRVGRVLRKYHLDELPQLLNVLSGQMSLVGPRPSPDQENQICPAWREMRLSVRPGLTGLWQIKRTRQPGTDFQEWIRYDLEYLERASFWLDMKILAQTAWAIVVRH